MYVCMYTHTHIYIHIYTYMISVRVSYILHITSTDIHNAGIQALDFTKNDLHGTYHSYIVGLNTYTRLVFSHQISIIMTCMVHTTRTQWGQAGTPS